jgi:hypothetical protein
MIAPPRPLPAEIVVPANRTLHADHTDWVRRNLAAYVVNLAYGLADDVWRLAGQEPAPPYRRGYPPTAVAAPARTLVRGSNDLRWGEGLAVPVLVDGVRVTVDVADWGQVEEPYPAADHRLRVHFDASHKAAPGLGSFPPATFLDWAYYDRAQAEARARRDPRRAWMVLNNQDAGPDDHSRSRRRHMVRGLLRHHFGARADFARTSPEDWHAKAAEALCYVQVPGSWDNSLDRGQLQMIGLGVPTISPPLMDQCGDGLLQPGIHYLACRPDYQDLPALVNWCGDHPYEAAAIGHNAWLFFQEFCTPLAVWAYVKDRIDHGPRHLRGTIDDDFCPPGLYLP